MQVLEAERPPNVPPQSPDGFRDKQMERDKPTGHSAAEVAKMGKFMEESFKSGKIVATGQLPRKVTQVELGQGEFSVSDGPFIEGKDLIPGFTVIDVDTKQEAIEWVKGLRECMGDGVLKMARLSATGMDDT